MYKNSLTLAIALLFLCHAHIHAFAKIHPLPEAAVKVNHKLIQTDTPLAEINGILFFPIQDFLDAFDATLTYQKKENLYKLTSNKSHKSVTFSPYLKDIKIDQSHQKLTAAPVLYETRLYLPLESFCELTGYALQKKNNLYQIMLLQTKKEGSASLENASEKSLLPFIKEKSELSIAIGDNIYDISTRFFYNKTVLFVDLTEVFKDLGVTPTTSERIKKNNHDYFPLLSTASSLHLGIKWDPRMNCISLINEFEKTTGNELQAITETHKNGTQEISISAAKSFTYTLSKFKNPPRIIIDIPDTVSKLPLVVQSENKVYQKIRTSQFTKSPAKSRIVIDLYKSNVVITESLVDNTLSISFPEKGSLIEPIKRIKHLKGKLITLDAGHGGQDPGALGINKTYEKFLTLDVIQKLKTALEEEGAKIILTRDSDQTVLLVSRPEIANKSKSDIFVSVHMNSFFNDKINGTETYFYKPKDKKLAKLLHEELVKTLKRRDNGLKHGKLFVLNHTNMPATLVEPVYITYPEEFQLIQNESFKDQIAKALLAGILKYFKNTND
ncbi:MAG: AMIN domain-containing protein [Candidatus Margulisbacteria bacterium]|nr:AMIN domain-containing protein [Candidatus Margulisiibacteriota bacterium]